LLLVFAERRKQLEDQHKNVLAQSKDIQGPLQTVINQNRPASPQVAAPEG
jgi:hypothetical protein